MLRQRIITTVIGMPFLIAAIWFGTPWLTILIAVVAVASGIEFYRMAGQKKLEPLTCAGIIAILLLVASPHCPYVSLVPALISMVIVITLLWILFRSPREKSFDNWAWTIAGIFFIGWTLSYWIELRILETGREWVFWILLIIVASDTGAYFVGRAIGKHFIAPAISPKKTWEGSIGGLVFSVIIAVVFGLVFSLPMTYWHMILLGAIINIFTQLGDFVESLLKRNTGVKDSSNIVPGHGGVLDRMDSFIFTGIIAYYYITIIIL
jgi:phosphatidate cytidylyltransferase